jgi:hypothetical protein
MPALDTLTFLDANALNVRLRIAVGHGQPGFTRVRLDGVLIASSDPEDATTLAGLDVDLGAPADLDGKSLETTTVIEDFVAATNQTSLTWEVDGANPPLNESREQLASNGARVTYSAKIRFKTS